MRLFQLKNHRLLPVLAVLMLLGTSCVGTKKMDHYVAEQFNNELPKIDSKKKSTIVVKSSIAADNRISHSYRKTEKVYPFIVYLQADEARYTDLNPAIPVSYFTKAVQSHKGLNRKLDGRTLELTVQQIPSGFAYVIRTRALLLLVHWSSTFQRQQQKDLIVSYKLTGSDNATKTGQIKIVDQQQKDYVFLRGWRSVARESIDLGRENVEAMSKSFVNKLMEEM